MESSTSEEGWPPPPPPPGGVAFKAGTQRAYYSEMLSYGLTVEDVTSRTQCAVTEPKTVAQPAAQSVGAFDFALVPSNASRTVFDDKAIEPKVLTAYEPKPGGLPRKLEIERRKRLYADQDLEMLLLTHGVDYSQPYVSSLAPDAAPARVVEHRPEDEDAAPRELDRPNDAYEALPLVAFDNDEYEVYSPAEWLAAGVDPATGAQRGLPARALKLSDELREVGEWKKAKVVGYDGAAGKYVVEWDDDNNVVVSAGAPATTGGLAKKYPTVTPDDGGGGGATARLKKKANEARSLVHRIHICFVAEDPFSFAERVADAHARRSRAEAVLLYNLYVDCMPAEGIKQLDSELCGRIVALALNTKLLRQTLETSTIIAEVNADYVRTLNQIVFRATHGKATREKAFFSSSEQGVSDLLASVNLAPAEHHDATPRPPAFAGTVALPEGASFGTAYSDFRFHSCLTRLEIIKIIVQVKAECLKVLGLSFFHFVTKSVRVDEFANAQAEAIAAVATKLRETWPTNVCGHVRQQLKEVKKGWFNLDEANNEVYAFSKLKKFLRFVNFVMQDTMRSLVEQSVASYASYLTKACDCVVECASPRDVTTTFLNDWRGGGGSSSSAGPATKRLPLFVVELVELNAGRDAFFGYAQDLNIFEITALKAFDEAIIATQSIVQVERRVMTRLFWSHNPVLLSVHPTEKWVVDLRAHLEETLAAAREPLERYIDTYADLVPFLQLDVDEYIAAQVLKFGGPDPAATDNDDDNAAPGAAEGAAATAAPPAPLNVAALRSLADAHLVKEREMKALIPDQAITVGLFAVSAKSLGRKLAEKHATLAARLMSIAAERTTLYADHATQQFAKVLARLNVQPTNIEELTNLRTYVESVPEIVRQLQRSIDASVANYGVLEAMHYKLAPSEFRLRWDVFGWPKRIADKGADIEAACTKLERTYETQMGEAQEVFAEKLRGLADEIENLKSFHDLKLVDQVAAHVRRIRADLEAADEEARLYNSREALFGKEVTEYGQLKTVGKAFEPYLMMWSNIDHWLQSSKRWMADPFVALDAERIEADTTVIYRALTKCEKTFEAQKLDGCLDVARTILAQVDQFRPHVPLVLALRQQGMRDRHWDAVSAKIDKVVKPDETYTLQTIFDLKLDEDVEVITKISEIAGKEFAIEASLDKMEQAWADVQLQIEPYRETGTSILRGIDEYMSLLDDHVTTTQAMTFSAFKGPFEDRIDKWNATLLVVSELVDEWVAVQKNWLYLQPIFDSADINKQLPVEGKRFATVDKHWRQTLGLAASPSTLAIVFCNDPKLLERFHESNKLLDMVQKGLSDYLETKRAGFARFYFLSDGDLLEILSETKDPKMVQPHLRKCFPEDDHELLTNKGFLSLEDVIARRHETDLLFADYDTKTSKLVYKHPIEVVINDAAPTDMVEFTHEHERFRWLPGADVHGRSARLKDRMEQEQKMATQDMKYTKMDLGDDDYDEVAVAKEFIIEGSFKAGDKAEVTDRSNRISIVATAEHKMFVKVGHDNSKNEDDKVQSFFGSGSQFKKHDAGDLADLPKNSVLRFMAAAEEGCHVPDDSETAAFVKDFFVGMGLETEDKQAAFLEVYGFWLGDGFLDFDDTGNHPCRVAFTQFKAGDIEFLLEKLKLCGVPKAHYDLTSTPDNLVMMTKQKILLWVDDPRWVSFFFGEYGHKYKKSKTYQPPFTSVSKKLNFDHEGKQAGAQDDQGGDEPLEEATTRSGAVLGMLDRLAFFADDDDDNDDDDDDCGSVLCESDLGFQSTDEQFDEMKESGMTLRCYVNLKRLKPPPESRDPAAAVKSTHEHPSPNDVAAPEAYAARPLKESPEFPTVFSTQPSPSNKKLEFAFCRRDAPKKIEEIKTIKRKGASYTHDAEAGQFLETLLSSAKFTQLRRILTHPTVADINWKLAAKIVAEPLAAEGLQPPYPAQAAKAVAVYYRCLYAQRRFKTEPKLAKFKTAFVKSNLYQWDVRGCAAVFFDPSEARRTLLASPPPPPTPPPSKLTDEEEARLKKPVDPIITNEGVKSAKWLIWWMLRLWKKQLAAAILRGYKRAADGSWKKGDKNMVFTASSRFRDQLVRLMLHAGYSARFELDKGADSLISVVNTFGGAQRAVVGRKNRVWKIAYSTTTHNSEEGRTTTMRNSSALEQPLIRTATDVKRTVYQGRTWCVTMPHGYVVVRRMRKLNGVIVYASVPTIQGNCFEGIKTLDFQEEDLTITCMRSPEKEVVQFDRVVDPKGKNIEDWMVEINVAMCAAVRDHMLRAVRQYSTVPRTTWMCEWPGQVVLNGSQVHWTLEVESCLAAQGNRGLKAYYETLVQQLSDMVLLIRTNLAPAQRTTVGALAVIDVHARDVIKKMGDAGVSETRDFDWQSQMRFYWEGDDADGDLMVIQVESKRSYGYEYLGNSFRLVITPLTDKCYLTLMGALQMILGGAPAGPAGTGKTETTKDLAKALAKQCVVFNCSDGLDYRAMGKFFKGLASAGAWARRRLLFEKACFDEFNRINIEVLSVIAQQIMTLQGAVQRGEDRIIFEDTDILVDPEFAVYITMNPGYAGRSSLPDNLEALFRPVAMMVPDYALIGEIMLFSYGYMDGRKCAKKMVATFRLCSEQLSSQDHYDYGMRAVKTVITAAGNLKRAAPEENEEALLLRALQDVNVPKFLAHDLPLFEGILSDLFPGIERPPFDYGPLLTALREAIAEDNLQAVPIFLRKNIELYEMICVRHGLMVVGPTGGGKSKNIHTLKKALTSLKSANIPGTRYERVLVHHLNPKSISMGQLYGMFDANTHEWQDGILAALCRQCIKNTKSDLQWLLFDGPVDAIWIENMNTVLDDNKKLCLTSGEIMSLSDPMTMMFEPEDLAVASPATVSRCGMIYMEPKSLGPDPLIQSWLATLPPVLRTPKHKTPLQTLFDTYYGPAVAMLRRRCKEPFPTVDGALLDGLLNLIDCAVADFHPKEVGEPKSQESIEKMERQFEGVFLFAFVWSVCATVDTRGRKMFDRWLRSFLEAQGSPYQFPAAGVIYDFAFDADRDSWVPWMETVAPYGFDPGATYSELIIPTMDSVRYTHLLDTLVTNNKHVLMSGPTGTGKTVNIQRHLQAGLPDTYVPICMTFSAQTSANQTQDLLDSKCEKRRKGIFGPSAGKKFVCFPEDHQLLTNHGYMFLKDVLAYEGDDLMFASYDVKKKMMIYEHAQGVIVNHGENFDDGTWQELVVFEAAAEDWSDDKADPYGRTEAARTASQRRLASGMLEDEESSFLDLEEDHLDDAAQDERILKNPHLAAVDEVDVYEGRTLENRTYSNHLSVAVTPEHEMFVQTGTRGTAGKINWREKYETSGEGGARVYLGLLPFEKISANDLLKDDGVEAVRMLPFAAEGLQVPEDCPTTAMIEGMLRDLGCDTEERILAFLEIYGFFLAEGSLVKHGIVMQQRTVADSIFLVSNLEKFENVPYTLWDVENNKAIDLFDKHLKGGRTNPAKLEELGNLHWINITITDYRWKKLISDEYRHKKYRTVSEDECDRLNEEAFKLAQAKISSSGTEVTAYARSTLISQKLDLDPVDDDHEDDDHDEDDGGGGALENPAKKPRRGNHHNAINSPEPDEIDENNTQGDPEFVDEGGYSHNDYDSVLEPNSTILRTLPFIRAAAINPSRENTEAALDIKSTAPLRPDVERHATGNTKQAAYESEPPAYLCELLGAGLFDRVAHMLENPSCNNSSNKVGKWPRVARLIAEKLDELKIARPFSKEITVAVALTFRNITLNRGCNMAYYSGLLEEFPKAGFNVPKNGMRHMQFQQSLAPRPAPPTAAEEEAPTDGEPTTSPSPSPLPPPKNEFIKSAKKKWFFWWIFRLNKLRARAVIRGLYQADGLASRSLESNVIFSSSVRFRDEIIRVLYHAGYSVRFDLSLEKGELQDLKRGDAVMTTLSGAWRIWFTEEPFATESKGLHELDKGINEVRRVTNYKGRTWCVKLPSGLLVVRRAVTNELGEVTRASKATIQGNCFVDDVNMPMKEVYGAQPPIELLRQWFDSSGWYDRKALTFRTIIDIVFVCACGPPGGGRNPLSARFPRHFNTIGYTPMQDESMKLIYETILTNFMVKQQKFKDEVVALAPGVVDATIEIYNTILTDLRPTPAKSHYQFNLRDVSKVFQGILMVTARCCPEPTDFARLFVHENRRVFADRLINGADHEWFTDLVDRLTSAKLGADFAKNAARDVIVFGDYMMPGADPRLYEEVKDLATTLHPTIEEYLAEYNADSKQPMELVMFFDAIQHVSRISRVIRQPKGNALLLGVGGSGRQSLTKLATFMADYKLYQIEIAKGYGMPEWRENLKEVLLTAGLKAQPVVFLFSDTQIVLEAMLEDVNNVLNTGDVPNLYGVEEMDQIMTTCKSDCLRKRLQPTKLNIFAQFIARVMENIHMVLCMSPLGEAFRTRLRKFPSIVNCTTIDWFAEWPEEALESVATTSMTEGDLNLGDHLGRVVGFVKHAHVSVARMSDRFRAELSRHNYVTPTSYLELLSTYTAVLTMKRREIGTLKTRLQSGLDKLISTAEQVSGLQVQLTEMQPVLLKTQEEVEVMIVNIDRDKKSAAETQVVVAAEEAAAREKEAETQAIADDAQRDLDEALPALDQAVKSLSALKKSDIDEVKTMGKPPAGVKLTMEACCIMFQVKPEIDKDPANPGKKVNNYFKAAQKELLSLGQKLIDKMKLYDKDNIPPKIIAQIVPYVMMEEFQPAVIQKASSACTAMCMWVRAMHKYHEVTIMVEPKKQLLAEATASLEVTKASLAQAQGKLKAVMDKIADLEADFTFNNDKKNQLVVDVEECSQRLQRAQKLIGGLGGERTRWTESCLKLEVDYENLVGDCLVSAAMIAYSGPFTPSFRRELTRDWQGQLARLDLPCSAHCDIRQTLADPVAIRQWTICGLPQDGHSVENGIIMSRARRFPLLVDPQGQANRFIKNMGKDPTFAENGIEVTKLSEKNFLRTLENGVRFGRWVLIENLGETLDAALEPLLLQQKFVQGGTEMIKIGDSTIPWNSSFRFYMTTKLTNPHYAPEVCVKVSLLNFAITPVGLEDQLLGVVVVEERPDMEEKKNSLVVANASMKKELKEIEDTILYKLSNSEGNILDDHELIETLASSKTTSTEIQVKVAEAETTEREIDQSREKYRPVAFRATTLYFAIGGLAVVDPMYQYSLQWFTALFISAIRQADKGGGGGGGDDDDHLEKRLKTLDDFFTYFVYTNVCRSLFENDKLLLSFLLTIRVLEGDKEMDPHEWRFLITGKGPVVGGGASAAAAEGDDGGEAAEEKRAHFFENPSPVPTGWIDARVWSEISQVSGLSRFVGFDKDFVEHLDEWRDFFDNPDPQTVALPSKWETGLNSFQKLCVLRAIRPDKIPDGVMSFVIEKLGQRFVEPPPFNLPACYRDSTNLTPLVFVLSKGSDPTKAFNEFCREMRFDRKVRKLSLGQGQGEKAAAMIEDASQKGTWVYLQNAHLFLSWLNDLERLCDSLTPDTTHKDFRLWLTSMPSDKFPVSILQNGVKMTNEPPKGLKANLKSVYFKLDDAQLQATSKPVEYRKLLFALVFFHASCQERRKFGPLGWNVAYEFNETDLDISRGQLEMFLDSYNEVPFRVLQFLTSYINYGGRVTDYIDLRTIDVLVKTFYNPKIFEPGMAFDDAQGTYLSIDADPDRPHASYMEYIETLPLTAGPGIFGMHENANISCAFNEAFGMFETLTLLQQGQSSSGGSSSGTGGGPTREELVAREVDAIAARVTKRGLFDIVAIGMRYPVVYDESMNTVLAQECIRYNKLIAEMLDSLPQLAKALQGLVVMSNELERMSESIAVAAVPAVWEAKAYPSMKPLGPWADDLMDRLDFIQNWIDGGIPAVFWISGFYFPQAFLTGSMQNFARSKRLPIDTVSFDYIMLDTFSGDTITEKPADGVYIRGLFLEGARWDPVLKALNDSRPKQLYSPAPLMHLHPVQDRVAPTGGVYRCPIYKVLSRRGVLSTTGHSTNFVMWVEIPSNRQDDINNDGLADQLCWCKAGVAAFCSLKF